MDNNIMDKKILARYDKIKKFLLEKNFNGFNKNNLFILSIMDYDWGHGIVTLSNMAESLVNMSIRYPSRVKEFQELLTELVLKAIHPKVNPYKKEINTVVNLGKFGYYLEHLNIILGSYRRIINDGKYNLLNEKISLHLINNSNSYSNFHADLLPNVNMKWSADQAAILYSLWLFDKNNYSDISSKLINNWIAYMNDKRVHHGTGLFKTEVLGTRKYSQQPRGCSTAYMVHYMSKFSPQIAKQQWNLFKKFMTNKLFGKISFREYLPEYNGKWTPDTGPIIFGTGVAATGLALNAASSIGDMETFNSLQKSFSMFDTFSGVIEGIIGSTIVTKLATDLLSTSIWFNAETKENWFD